MVQICDYSNRDEEIQEGFEYILDLKDRYKDLEMDEVVDNYRDLVSERPSVSIPMLMDWTMIAMRNIDREKLEEEDYREVERIAELLEREKNDHPSMGKERHGDRPLDNLENT